LKRNPGWVAGSHHHGPLDDVTVGLCRHGDSHGHRWTLNDPARSLPWGEVRLIASCVWLG